MPALDIGEAPGVGQGLAAAEAGAVLDGPTGEGAGGLINILVDVAGRLALEGAGDFLPAAVQVVEVGAAPERVQLQKLAGVIFVGDARAGTAVVEIDQHRRAPGHRLQKLTEVSQGVAAQGAVVVRQRRSHGIVANGVDVEMIVPEADQHLAQLPAGTDRALDRRRRHLLPR